ncbi:cobalamin B12-binding domain-containing protein [Bacillus alkalicellulosilyticus]|uniref:cobalamin B12-binding domain-containing protein n=1 Tax=Alkalihalobacterium alkalicellulosilyticum TaxID=1912214 RepID=UPI000998189C|nr:cobalamin-dependent protein [Bacillus alkalicellulosilyticus]
MVNDSTRLKETLLIGNRELAWELIEGHISAGKDTVTIFEDIIAEAMREIGLLWEENIISVAEEHLATITCDYLLSRYQYYLQRKTKKRSGEHHRKALFFCVEEEYHFIGIKMTSILFEENGWNTKFYGVNVPVESAMEAIKVWKPDVVGLSVSIIYHMKSFIEYTKQIAALKNSPFLIVGGRIVDSYDMTKYCNSHSQIFNSLSDINMWLSSQQNMGGLHVH